MVEEVLPDVPYAQLVLTIPKMLRPPFLWDRKLYGDLCRSAYAATKTFFHRHFPELHDAVFAMVVAPQSFGNLANFRAVSQSLRDFRGRTSVIVQPLRDLRNQNRLTARCTGGVLAVRLEDQIIGSWATLELIGSPNGSASWSTLPDPRPNAPRERMRSI